MPYYFIEEEIEGLLKLKEDFKLALIAAVMQFCRADSEALQLHLSGKQDHKFVQATALPLQK